MATMARGSVTEPNGVVQNMDQFNSLPEGTTVTVTTGSLGVRGAQWTKNSEGWENNGYTIHPRHFQALVENGSVSLGQTPRQAQVWAADGRHSYLVVEPGTESEGGGWWVAVMRHHVFSRLARFTPDNPIPGRPVEPPPPWRDTVMPIAQALVRSEQARQEMVASGVLGRPTQRRLQAALHEWMADNDHIDDDQLIQILQENGMDPPQEGIEVTIEVQGENSGPVPVPDTGNLVPQGAVVDEAETTVRWRRTFIQEVDVPWGDCGCQRFGRSEVHDLLRDEGVTADDWDFEIRCTNCD